MRGSRNQPSRDDLELIYRVARTTARRVGTNHYEADDVAQMTTIKLWARWNDHGVRVAREHSPERWRGYIILTARNQHRDLVRSHQRRLDRELRASTGLVWAGRPLGAIPTDSGGIEAYLARTTIAGEIERLPEHQHTVATRYFLDNWSIAEIAKDLGVQTQTVRKHLRAAKSTLERRIEEDEVDHRLA